MSERIALLPLAPLSPWQRLLFSSPSRQPCYAAKDKTDEKGKRPGPCIDADFVQRILAPAAGSRGGVLETTLEPGDLLIFANQSRAALYHTNPLLYHMNPPT